MRDLQANLHEGRWLPPQLPLLRIVEAGVRLRGYLAEKDLWRVAADAEGRFIADDPSRAAIRVRLVQLDSTGAPYLQLEALASDRQGPIAVRRDEQQRAEPVQAQYGMRLQALEELPSPTQPLRGVVQLQGRGESLLGAAWRRVAALGVRESGF